MKTPLFSLLAATLLLSGSQGAVVAGWDFDPLPGGAANYGPSPFAAATTDPNAVVGGLVRGSGIGTTTNSGAANAWGGNDFTIVTPTFAVAEAASEFATISITPAAGYTLSLSDIGSYNVRRSSSGPTSGQWQYQLGVGTFVDIGTAITWGTITTAAGNPQTAIDLSGILDLQSIAGGTTVTLRLVTWGATSTGGTWYLNDPSNSVGNDFTINGAVVAVPEPAAALLGSLGLILMLRRRR